MIDFPQKCRFNPIGCGGRHKTAPPAPEFLLTPQYIYIYTDIRSFFLLFLILNMERFEPLFASTYNAFYCQEGHDEKNPGFHKVEFCPELEISKIGNQKRCHFWHVAHTFWVVFSESILVL